MHAHLLEAWRAVAAGTVTFYHGTNQAALDSIMRDGEIKGMSPEAVAHEIEKRYGLPYNSVWMYKYNEFSRGRVNDPNVYLSDSYGIAAEYASLGSEVVFDALNSVVHIQQWDKLVDAEGNYRPGAADIRQAWIAEETRKHYQPVVLTLAVPEDQAPPASHSTLMRGPLPASWIVSVS